MIRIEMRLLGSPVLELRVGRENDDSDDGSHDEVEVDATDYIWAGVQPPISLSHARFAPVEDEVDWDDLAEEWADLDNEF